MTVTLFNAAASTTYKPTNAAVNQTKIEALSGMPPAANQNNIENTSFEPEVFTQNVLQSLQKLGVQGVDANGELLYAEQLSPEAGEALHSFVKGLYQAISPNIPRQALPIETIANAEEINSSPLLVGGTNFKYAVDLSEAELGDYFADVKANLKNALDNIGEHISSKIVFNLKVVTEYGDEHTLAAANSTVITSKNNGEDSLDTSFISDSMYGVELSPDMPDSKLYVNLARMEDMSFLGEPTPDKYDFTTVLTHEILHGLAFSGTLNSDNPLKTGFDELVTMTDSGPVFTGRHARTVNNGKPVPLAPESAGQGSSFYHIDIPDDLMAASIKKGEVKKISPLNVAMLQDIGVGIVNSNGANSSKVQNTYGSPSVNLQNLIGSIKQTNELEENFTHLVETLDNNNVYSSVNLHDFLSELAATAQEDSSYQSAVGALVSVNA